jgi:hypothetical protein
MDGKYVCQKYQSEYHSNIFVKSREGVDVVNY